MRQAHLLLAKWTDRAGQTQSDVIVQRYREAIKLHSRYDRTIPGLSNGLTGQQVGKGALLPGQTLQQDFGV
jgi:hypothetical protein